MFQKLPFIKSRKMVKILKKVGFIERRQTGSQRNFIKYFKASRNNKRVFKILFK